MVAGKTNHNNDNEKRDKNLLWKIGHKILWGFAVQIDHPFRPDLINMKKWTCEIGEHSAFD